MTSPPVTSPSVIELHDAISDCWNRIGVVGDQSCDKLPAHIHCRNCDVYAQAAQRNLQRPIDAQYRQHWASHFRARQADGDAKDNSVLVFRIGREWLALPTRVFDCVAPQAKPHVLPHRSGRGLLGIVNIGGQLYPCISLASLLGIDEHDAPAARGRHTFARLLLMRWEEQSFALPVADLHGIVRHAASALQAPAATINKGLSRFLSGVITDNDLRIGCLDTALIGFQLARLLR